MIKLYRCEVSENVSDMLIRQAAEELCGVKTPVILRTEHGKPYFRDLPIKFSISHSEKKAIMAVSDREIGADIQKIKPIHFGIADRFFTEDERMYVGDDIQRFFEIWTKKEAYGKWEGRGLLANAKVDVTALEFYTETDGEYIIAVYEKKEP